jgi:hypothetical protein
VPARRRIEPWPLALVGLLAFMIGVCGALYAVAASHVDPEVELLVADPSPAAAPEDAR